jgi:hypothetical protein
MKLVSPKRLVSRKRHDWPRKLVSRKRHGAGLKRRRALPKRLG